MPIIHFSFEGDDGDSQPAPVNGVVEMVPTRRPLVDDSIVLPQSFTVRLPGGDGSTFLAPTGPDWCWQATEKLIGESRRYVAVPDLPGPLEYADLVDVDPSTLDPIQGGATAWLSAADKRYAHYQDDTLVIDGQPVPLGASGTVDWDDVEDKPAAFPPSAHQHAGADITSGQVAPARLGTGTRDGTRFLRDDGAWAAPPSGGAGSIVFSRAVDATVSHPGTWEALSPLVSLDTPADLAAGQTLRITATWNVTTGLNGYGYLRLILGSTVMFQQLLTPSDLSAGKWSGFRATISIRSLTDQAVLAEWLRGFNGNQLGGPVENQSVGMGVATEDLTSPKTLKLAIAAQSTDAAIPAFLVKQTVVERGRGA